MQRFMSRSSCVYLSWWHGFEELISVVSDGVPEDVHLLLREVVAQGVGGELLHGQVHDLIHVLTGQELKLY